jgi:glutamate formiminotransferase / formiminotetrahydrofolate cyclodeaminase
VESMALMQAMAASGLPASVSDAGVGALCARAGALGAYLNVRINCSGLDDKDYTERVIAEAEKLRQEAERIEKEVMETTLSKV